MKRRPNRRGRPRRGSGGRDKRAQERSSAKPTSSFAALRPSTASVALLAAPKRPSPVCAWPIVGLTALCPLVFFSGYGVVLMPALALILPGLALLLRPPEVSPGRLLEWASLLFLAALLAAFIPAFYWLEPEWRAVAVDFHGIALPSLLSVQPLISLEAWIQVAAGFAWFYAAYSWPLNDNGRRWFFFALSLFFGLFGGVVVWAHQGGFYQPGGEAFGFFRFFPEWEQTSGFLTVGGVALFAFAVKEFQSRSMASILAFLASGLCFLAVFRGAGAWVFGFFIAGLLLCHCWWVFGRHRVSLLIALGFPVILALVSVFRFRGNFSEAFVPKAGAIADALRMWGDAPLAGVGLGNFAAIFPQYDRASIASELAARPFNDPLWLLVETGVLGLVGLGLVVLAYWAALRAPAPVHGRSVRIAAVFGLVMFVFLAWAGVPAREPGLIYLVLLLAAVALPPPASVAVSLFKPVTWRVFGGVLLAVAAVWLVAGLDRMPLHSQVALVEWQRKVEAADAGGNTVAGQAAVDAWLRRMPLEAAAYQWQGRFKLRQTSSMSEAAAAFDRARFVEPKAWRVPYDQGFYWLSFDGKKAIEAWEEALRREMPDPVAAFSAIVAAASARANLAPGLARLSHMDERFRLVYLNGLAGDLLMREIQKELEQSPTLAQFDRAQRSQVLRRWITKGNLAEAERFLDAYPDSVDREWWLRAIADSKKANFAQAVQRAREHLRRPVFPPVKEGAETVPLVRLKREFWLDSGDTGKGLTLLQILIEEAAYAEALAVCDAMLESSTPHPDLHYWRGECLYQLGDYIESWFAFEVYIESLGD